MNSRAPKAADIFPVFLHFLLALRFDPRVRAENIWLVQQHQPRRFPATLIQPTKHGKEGKAEGRGQTPLQESAASRKRASRSLSAPHAASEPHPLPPPPTDDKWSASPKREKAMPASSLPIQPPTAQPSKAEALRTSFGSHEIPSPFERGAARDREHNTLQEAALCFSPRIPPLRLLRAFASFSAIPSFIVGSLREAHFLP